MLIGMCENEDESAGAENAAKNIAISANAVVDKS